jgi:carboxyl-terminal processing protease
MKPLVLDLIPAVSISVALAATASAFGFRSADPLDPKATDAATTALTTKILESSQFAHRQLDTPLAGKFLGRYLDNLDGAHFIFFQGDIDEFKKSVPTLAEATRDAGDSGLAQRVFKRYLERLTQRAGHITKLLEAGEFDFSSDEKIEVDRKKAAHPANMAAAKTLWTAYLRNEYLEEKLAGKKPAQITKVLKNRTSRTLEKMRKLDEREVLEIYLKSLAEVYDPHSDYMGPKQLKEFQDEMNLSFIGIGASLREDDGYCKIMELVPGSPAARSGLLQPGDRIVGVSEKEGGEFTDLVDLPLNDSVKLIRGKMDTTVYLNIIPASATDQSARKTISLIRAKIKTEDKQAKALIMDLPDGGQTRRIGVIELPGFYAGDGTDGSGKVSCTEDVKRLLEKLKAEQVTGIVLDLRYNGGGSLQESIDLTGLFIASGPIVQTRTLDGRTEVGRDQDKSVVYDGPLVVLTSRLSASASEILAGALQDYGRAVIVGDTSTFGKGTVQSIQPLARIMSSEGITPGSDPGALKVTISKFYRPSGKSTQLEGVKADIVLPSATDTPEIGESDLIDPLPWDTIPAAAYIASNLVAPSLEELRKESAKRIAKDPSFVDLKASIERSRKLRAEKTVSLSEAQRTAAKDEFKALTKAMKKGRIARGTTQPLAYEVTVQSAGKPGLGEIYKPKPRFTLSTADEDDIAEANIPYEDPTLTEAKNILLDYTRLLDGQLLASEGAKEEATPVNRAKVVQE